MLNNIKFLCLLTAMLLIGACDASHALLQDTSGSKNDGGITVTISKEYANPFISSQYMKLISYSESTGKYTIVDFSTDYAFIDGQNMKKLSDGSLIFRGQGKGKDDREQIFRYHSNGETEVISPIALFPFDADIYLNDFGGFQFSIISETKIAIPYSVSFADKSREVHLVEYDVNTAELRDVTILEKTAPEVKCPDTFTDEEKAQLATAQVLADTASSEYVSCLTDASRTCVAECQADADAKAALCTLTASLYEKYSCGLTQSCASAQCAMQILK